MKDKLETFAADVRFALRTLARNPGFAIVAVLTLALGIGANTAIFSVVNTVLLKPFAYRDPARIVMFQNVLLAGRTGSASPREFNWWRQESQPFQDVSAYDFDVANLTGEPFPLQIPTLRASANFFNLCGANAVQGRTFTMADDFPNAPRTVVLAYAFWQRHFDGDARVVGRRMTLSGERYEIIGVVGPGLRDGQIAERSRISGDIEIHQPPDVYIPFQIDPNDAGAGHHFNVAGRLKPGVTLAEANARLQASFPGYGRKWPDDVRGRAGFRVQPLQDAIVDGVRSPLLILLGAVSLVLLIACANVANLLLARAAERTREIVIRAAMGAGRGRIVQQLLTESLVMSLTGGVLGLAAGSAGIRALLSLSPGSIPRIGPDGSNVGLDWRVFGFTLAVSLLTGVLFGLLPAVQSSRTDLTGAMKESGNRSGTGWRHNKTRALLVAAEMALAVVLLIGAGLLIRSFIAIRQVNPGFDAHQVLTMRVSLTGPEFAKPADVMQVIHEGLRRIRALPGVDAAATTCCLPLEDRFLGVFKIAGRPEGPTSGDATGTNWVSADYFEVFKIPILRGRAFTERDEIGPPVVVINQAMAKRFWPDGDPLRDQIVMGDQARQIVGIVGDVHDDLLSREPRINVYEPLNARAGILEGRSAWVIRTRWTSTSLSAAIENELRDVSGGLPVARVRTMDEILSRSSAAEDFNALVLTIFGCSAMVLAAIGIYGLMAYSVAQRTREIGIRLALGAESDQIRNMVVVEGLRPALAGAVCGLVAALGLARLISSLLFGVKPWDAFVLLVVPVLVVGVALVAVWLPARRASRVAPIDALRYD